ncbi:hypothetical protein [Halorubellus salinus]|uniref:hypothetical protein n=1 Tax=Halorubellus salinus TaxID=755309 RepID=UPI001D08F855|nr:hypothetical protein [Halorubellus salinus]
MTHSTRRRVLAIAAATAATGAVSTVTATPGKGDERGNARSFGAVYANDVLWRTNVVEVLDSEPSRSDAIYFLHDGTQPIVGNSSADDAQLSLFVSESAPGGRDWNGGQWVHYSAEITDLDAFNADAPLTRDTDVLDTDYIDVTKGRPSFGPPNYFICPLNGNA